MAEHTRPLDLTYPPGLYSLSHVALPFPMNDALYGLTPDPSEDFGINLGTLAPRGERNVLIASLDSLLRVASNPFPPYMIKRIEENIDSPAMAWTQVPPPPTETGGQAEGAERSSGRGGEPADLGDPVTDNEADPSGEPP